MLLYNLLYCLYLLVLLCIHSLNNILYLTIIQIALVIVLGNNLINSLSDIQTSIWYWLLTVIKIIGEILLVYLVANDIRLFSIGIKNTIY